MTAPSPVTPAPGALELVRAFVNTRDVEAGTDRLADPASWNSWAGEHGIAAEDAAEVTDTQLRDARHLREALRAALLANHDRLPLPAVAIDALDVAADQARLALRFTADGARLVPEGTGLNALYGLIVSSVSSSLSDGTWSRLKACANDSCQWGFYDISRSRTGQWCSMSICGNRAKQARFRERSSATSAG